MFESTYLEQDSACLELFAQLPGQKSIVYFRVAGCHRAGTTIDHVVPRSRGGEHTWENVVLMCKQHNRAKSDKFLSQLGWKLKRQPRAPRGGGPYLVLVAASRTPAAAEAWAPYLPSAA